MGSHLANLGDRSFSGGYYWCSRFEIEQAGRKSRFPLMGSVITTALRCTGQHLTVSSLSMVASEYVALSGLRRFRRSWTTSPTRLIGPSSLLNHHLRSLAACGRSKVKNFGA